MFKQRCLAVVLISILFIAPLANLNDSSRHETLADRSISESDTLNGWPDVPTWRIGDKYTYETQFDVQDLIEQANVQASLNTLTGDTTYEVTEIFYEYIDDVQTLAYKMRISGVFSSNTEDDDNGATLEGALGRLVIYYDGEDIIRARDLAVYTSNFTLNVDFWPNIPFLGPAQFLSQDLADINFDTIYLPPKEKYDFPLRVGDQWYMNFFASTTVSGDSDYFDLSGFDTAGPENNTWQITDRGIPTQDGENIEYSGCDDSYKINEWNTTGISQGFAWYCPDVRYNSWMRVSNAAGFTIDWLLKSYEPADSQGVDINSNPGNRNYSIDVEPESIAVCPNCLQNVSIDYSGEEGVRPGINLQLRYELTNTYLNPTTDENGKASQIFDSSDVVDDTNSSDDYTSNGLLVWDPFHQVIGAATIIIDPAITDVDLVAQTDAIILTRTRGDSSSVISKFNALPGDNLSFSIPTQNRGKQISNATSIQITTPDGQTSTQNLPAIPAYSEARVQIDFQIPANQSIGNLTFEILVDPDGIVVEDSNVSNNFAFVNIFIGREPTAIVSVIDEVYTKNIVIIDASASFDEDGGDVECEFTLEKDDPSLVDIAYSSSCILEWNWSDGKVWNIGVVVIDDESDTDTINTTATVLNQAPYINLSVDELSIDVNNVITINAEDSGDNDSISPEGQEVEISWPGLNCEGTELGPICRILVINEGPFNVTAIATDDDGAVTSATLTIDVLNVAPILSSPELWKGGQNQSTDSMGYWNLDEDETVILRAVADDTPLDKDTLIIEWMPSDKDENWTVTTVGSSSQTTAAWPTSGLHNLTVVAYDNDNEKSAIRTGIVNISNVPPTIANLGSTQPIFEDNNITFTAEITDTASDIDNLEICWDLDSMTDVDGDGFADNDCEISGLEMTASWPTSGIRWITATVTDDDGASDSTSINVSVINGAPRAKITNNTDVLSLNEGDNVTLSGITTTDTAFDKLSLIYAWDSNHIDSNLDGETTGDIDHYGAEWLISDLPAGTWLITMTATDDDGASNTATIEIVVKAKPAEDFLESITNAVGGVGTLVIGILAIVVIGLAAFLLLTRNSTNPSDKYSELNLPSTPSSQFKEPISTPSADAGFGLFQQEDIQADQPHTEYNQPPVVDRYNPEEQISTQPDIYPTYDVTPQPITQPSVSLETTAKIDQGPPLPATGLPEGWTMEQWQHYGAQYIAAQTPNVAKDQATNKDTTTQSAHNSLNDVLDDLDL